MTPKQRVMAVLNLEMPDKVPFADWIDPGIRKTLAAHFGDVNMDDATFHKNLGADAICYVESDYIAPQFCKTLIDDQGVEHLQSEGLIKSENDLGLFLLPDVTKPGYFDKAKRYMDRYGNSGLAIFASLRTGMMNTIFAMGLVEFSMALYKNISFIETLFDRYIEWNIKVAEGLTAAGFDFLVCYDDIAFNTGPIIPLPIFREIFVPRMKKFAGTLTLPWVYHSCGNVGRVFDDLMDFGMNGFNPFQPDVNDIFEIKQKYGDKIFVWGNIDLNHTLTRGTIEETITEVKAKIKQLAPGGGYMMATANSITDYCKIENILAMMETKDKYGTYPI